MTDISIIYHLEKFLNSNSGAQDRGNRKGKLFWKFDSNAARPGSFFQLLAVFINVLEGELKVLTRQRTETSSVESLQ